MEGASSTSRPKMNNLREQVLTRMLVMVMAMSNITPSAGGRVKVILADETGFKKALVNKKHENKLKIGRKLFIKKFAVRDDTIFIGENSSVFYGSGSLEIPQHINEAAKIALNNPTTPVKSVQEVLKSPIKSKVSFKGRLTTQTMTRIVTVRGEEAQVKEITIRDTTAEVKVSLWRDATKADISVGEEIIIMDGTLSYNNYFKSPVVNINSLDEIKEIETEPVIEKVTIFGICEEIIVGLGTVHITCNVGDEEREMKIGTKLLFEILDCDHLDSTDDIMEQLPIEIKCCIEKNLITGISI